MLKSNGPRTEDRSAKRENELTNTVDQEETDDQGEFLEADFLNYVAPIIRSDARLSISDVARLRLIALMAGTTNNDQYVLGVHDSNAIYANRESLNLSFLEKRGLLESGLSSIRHENTPVWTVLADLSRQRAGILEAMTIFGELSVRVGALFVMRLLGKDLNKSPKFARNIVSRHWLADDAEDSLRVAALAYLRDFGDISHLPSIFKEVERAAQSTVGAAGEAAVSIYLRSDKREAVRYILSLSFESFDQSLLRQALDLINELSSEDIEKGLDHRSSGVRACAVKVLSERGVLNFETVARAREDDAAAVRRAALFAMSGMGQPASLDEAQKTLSRPRNQLGLLLYRPQTDTKGEELFRDYRATTLLSMPESSLKALLSAPEHRDAAYRALALRRIDGFGQKLREDLRDGFRTYFNRYWPKGVVSESVGSTILSMMGTFDPNESKRRELVRNALDVLCEQRDKSDLALIRDVLDLKEIMPTTNAVAYLKSIGGPDDINRLVVNGDLKYCDEAADAVLSLYDGLVQGLLMREMPDDIFSAVVDKIAPSDFSNLSDKDILYLILSDNPSRRRSVSIKASYCLTKSRIIRIQRDYRADEGGRYYLVYHWLDLGLAYSKNVAFGVVSRKR